MVPDSGAFAAQLLIQSAGADIAGGTDFQRDLSLGEQIHEGRIIDRGDAMADAFGTEEFDGFANFFRAADFTGVHQAVQAQVASFVVGGAKFFSWYAEFVAADAEGYDFFRGGAAGGFNDLHGGVDAELTGGVEDPVHGQAAFFKRFGGTQDGFKIGFRPLLAEKHDADGESDFGVDDALGQEVLGEVRG